VPALTTELRWPDHIPQKTCADSAREAPSEDKRWRAEKRIQQHFFQASEQADDRDIEMPTLPSSQDDDIDRSKPLVLLLGNVDHEGVTHALKAAKRQYKKKTMASSTANWRSIVAYFQHFDVQAAVGKFNAEAYTLLADLSYEAVREILLATIAARPHIMFAFEDFISGLGADVPDPYPIHRRPPIEVLNAANANLRKHKINLIPYRTNADLTVMATQFLDDVLEGLLFRIYVPSGRLWASEVDRLIQLFRDYLVRIGRKGVRLDQTKTNHGVSYEFRGDRASTPTSLSADFQDFSHFLDLCVYDPQGAERLLKEKCTDPKEVADLLTRYSKEARRLQTDLKHERERKLLAIRQRLESELADILPGAMDWKVIDSLVEHAVPSATSTSVAHLVERGLGMSSRPELPVSIHVNSQVINTVNGVVAHEIRGDVNLSERDRELLQLVSQHAGDQALELASAVRMLADEGISKPQRLGCGQKLKSFLYSIAPKLGQTALNVLQSYLERKLG
jgi:hypothetical protein